MIHYLLVTQIDYNKRKIMKESKRIIHQRRDTRGFSAFLKEIQEAAKDGWEVDVDGRGLKNGPTFAPYFSCWVHKGEDEVIIPPEEEVVPPTAEATPSLVADTSSTQAAIEDVAVDPTVDVAEGVVDKLSVDILFDKKTKAADLAAFAKQEGIEIPEDIKVTPAIKKFLKEQVNKQT